MSSTRYHDTVGILPGRFSGLTKNHKQLISLMANEHARCYVIVVKGQKTSTDHERNPFPENVQWQMLKSILPTNVDLRITHGNLIDNLTTIIKTDDHKKFAIYIGPDRLEKFRPAIKYIRNETHKKISVIDTGSMLPREPDVSGTAFRKALQNDDRDAFICVAPKEIVPMYAELFRCVQQ